MPLHPLARARVPSERLFAQSATHHAAAAPARHGSDAPSSDEAPPWSYLALLWLCAWSRNYTLMHIPKTGGSTLEVLDYSAPIRTFRSQRRQLRNSSSVSSLFHNLSLIHI